MKSSFETYETAWCPGCGNFGILESLKTALGDMGKKPQEVLVVGGIGQAAKLPQYISANRFCGLHGRALPVAVAAKIANEALTVIVTTGDGDCYGEGGNHFVHNIRRNVDITLFVHDNRVYGLTKGQASPTSDLGFVTGVQTDGNIDPPLDPVMFAIAASCGFVARAYAGDKEHLADIMKKAIAFRGFSFVDILQPCVSFNKVNTYAYFSKRAYRLDDAYDPSDKLAALKLAMEPEDRLPLGILYREQRETFHEKNGVLKKGGALIERQTDKSVLNHIVERLA